MTTAIILEKKGYESNEIEFNESVVIKSGVSLG